MYHENYIEIFFGLCEELCLQDPAGLKISDPRGVILRVQVGALCPALARRPAGACARCLVLVGGGMAPRMWKSSTKTLFNIWGMGLVAIKYYQKCDMD